MAFPTDLDIEVAFNNDIDETNFAQSGWTSILPFVASYNGDLRGRQYERDQAEAGTLSVTLDNSDGRFIPGSVQSPYYPYVKSDRRFRIRGKNMVHPNVARGGSRDRNMTGFIVPDSSLNLAQYTALTTVGSSDTENVYAMDSVRVITASAEPFAGVGEGKEKANDGLANTKWVISTEAGWLVYKLAIGVRITRYSITTANDFPVRDPASWTLQGSNNGSSWTTIHTVTGNTWTDRYEKQQFTVTSPNFYLYYKLDITANQTHGSTTQLAEWTINYDDPTTDLLLVDSDLTHYVEVNVNNNQSLLNAYRRTLSWYAPLEYGVRLAHSIYLWRISGTEPTGAKLKLDITYWDQNWVQVNSSVNPSWEITTLPTTTTPTQIGFSHTPPAEAKYGVISFSVYLAGTTNSGDLVYGLTGIQSELPVNLASDISGFRDQINWQIEGDGDGDYLNVGSNPTTSYLSVLWGVNDVDLFQTIPHLIPGEMYTATVEAKKLSGQPNILFSGDEGETGALISTTTFTQYTTSFEAQQAEQELRFILQGASVPLTEGLQVRKLRIERGDALVLTLPTTAIEAGFTAWDRPKDIFEGWVESWPAIGGSTEMTITVVDRLKRLGQVELSNTLKESLLQDGPQLLMPLTDSMLDTPGRFSQLGSWANEEGGPAYVDIKHSKGDLGASSYTTQTDDGPTGEASFKSNPIGSAFTAKGYFFAIPFSKDYVAPPPPVPGKPQPKPPPTSTPTQKSTYTKRWNAIWSRSYEGNDSTRFDDSPYMYQGSYDGSSPGNQKSLAGFDYKNIQATLKGAEIIEAHFTVKNYHARWNKGLYAQLGTHNYTSKPSTWSSGTVTERKWKKWVAEGGSLTVDIGASTGRAFRDGGVKGLAIGPEATNDHDNYGFFYGASNSARPYLTIKYRK